MPLLFCTSFLFSIFLLAACNDSLSEKGPGPDHSEHSQDTLTADTARASELPKADSATTASPAPNPNARYTYHFIHPKDSAGKAELKGLSKEQMQIVYAINRVDPGPAKRTDTLVIPDQWEADLIAYSPFPAHVPGLQEVKKIIIFSYPIQAFGVYENGQLIRWGPTSMGKKATPTPIGLFFSNWKSKEATSTVDPTWKLKWNFNVSNKGGVGWHQYAMPGYPASHSCMRLFDYDAQWLYDWADQWRISPDRGTVLVKGTPCIIYGKYAFGQLKPWRRLPLDGADNDISPGALMAEITPHLEKIMEAQRVRDEAPPLVARTEPADTARRVNQAP